MSSWRSWIPRIPRIPFLQSLPAATGDAHYLKERRAKDWGGGWDWAFLKTLPVDLPTIGVDPVGSPLEPVSFELRTPYLSAYNGSDVDPASIRIDWRGGAISVDESTVMMRVDRSNVIGEVWFEPPVCRSNSLGWGVYGTVYQQPSKKWAFRESLEISTDTDGELIDSFGLGVREHSLIELDGDPATLDHTLAGRWLVGSTGWWGRVENSYKITEDSSEEERSGEISVGVQGDYNREDQQIRGQFDVSCIAETSDLKFGSVASLAVTDRPDSSTLSIKPNMGVKIDVISRFENGTSCRGVAQMSTDESGIKGEFHSGPAIFSASVNFDNQLDRSTVNFGISLIA